MEKTKEKILEFVLLKFEKALGFQVLHQAFSGYVEFTASNGWTIVAGAYPFINTDEQTISLRGVEDEYDEAVDIDYYNDNEMRDEYLVQIIEAVEEFMDDFTEKCKKKEKEEAEKAEEDDDIMCGNGVHVIY